MFCQVVEEGSHEELLSTKGGVYSGLVKRQLDLGDKADREDIGQSTPGPSTLFKGRKTLYEAETELGSTSTGSCDTSVDLDG